MAYSKNETYSGEEMELAKIAKALSHPARISILKILANSQNCVCSLIVDELPISQSTVSQHLKELKSAGLVQGEIDPPKVKYCIHKENWEKAKDLLNKFFVDYANSSCC